ncbi:Acyl-CoA dehydrogenase, short-chain specific [Nocardioides dokdonensis FR1436]|uniref:Acyl-CoA dehydrogenase, short-chain specific n=1 Tax=Nocardioides dokdonensis FR1436 TaxID=1300347 RepID=A0A1A9GFP9_9ACTN|nr:acyl-CoA dehydrogenase family protein [Nocardioides dokdonensis]ANH37074.1 Acyl-CoA dehydrogenase, short-chain specific [Nocardioides dokdonensis FR1436]
MRFVPTSEQEDFTASLDRLLAGADTVAAARGWAEGDTAAGLALWRRLAEQGVHALLVPEEHGGMGASPTEMVLALELVGRHAVPGPWVESVAYLPLALGSGPVVEALAEGAVGTVAVAPHVPYALDADLAEHRYAVVDGALHAAEAGEQHTSVDGTRRLFSVTSASPAETAGDLDRAFDTAVLATAAQLLGAGERILADSVTYVKQRKQFGREIGSYQAIKHQLADVRIALDFARPLVQGAALAEPGTLSRDVSAAKLAAADAAYLAARVGLQVHGAIGYTLEFDLSLWITKVRALVAAWGTTAFHRDRVLAALVAEQEVGG